VNKALDLARKEKTVGNSLEARLTLAAGEGLAAFIRDNAETLAEIVMVSELELAEGLENPTLASEEMEGLLVGIEPTAFAKCPRCWKRRPEVGADAEHEVCNDCLAALSQAE
jgi:isoleucyl-tRNA synthetase